MASVLKNGEISPNFSYHLYSSDKDQFTMSLNKEIEIERTVNGEWKIPHFDSSKYKVNVGFGIGKKIIAWGYVLSEITPGQSLTLSIGGYAILMSDGQLRIGDSVKSSQDKEWEIKIGKEYLLNFDDCGRGKLTSL